MEPVPEGRRSVRFTFQSDGGAFAGGELVIAIDGRQVARGRVPRTIMGLGGIGETLDIGRDTGVPVSDDFGRAPFSGRILRVDVTLRD